MPIVDPRLQGKPIPKVSVAQMERGHVARLKAMKGSEIAFVDQRIPRYEREIINLVGMSVTENMDDPLLKPKVQAGAHGFGVTYIRAPQGKGAALHRHATEEVFITLKGKWQIFWMEGETERAVDLEVGDICNVPIGIYRGFRNVSPDPDSTLLAVIGGPDSGKVDWHPSVLTEARKTGLDVDDDGNLIVRDAAE